MRRFCMLMLLCLLGFGLMVGMGAEALAQPTPIPPATGQPPATVQPPAATQPPAAAQPPASYTSGCSRYVGLSNRIVMCLRTTIANAAGKFYGQDANNDGRTDAGTGFYNVVRLAIGGFLTLVVIVYGILAAYGMLEKPGRDIMILMFKLSLVTSLVVQSEMLYDKMLEFMDGASAAVVGFTPSSGPMIDGVPAQGVTCVNQMVQASNDAKIGYSAAWLGMDCVLDSVIGIKVASRTGVTQPTEGPVGKAENPNLGNETGMSRGLIRFFFSSMQSSILGILLAVVGFMFLYSLVWMVIKSLFVYIAGYLGIAFLMIFAPVFIPLMLFRVTSEYFKKWVKLSLAFALQPVIILAFISFAIAAIDLAMFSGDYSVMYRIAGQESRNPNFNLNKYLEEKKIVIKTPQVLAQVRASTKTPNLTDLKTDAIYKDLKISDCDQRLREADKNKNFSAEQMRKTLQECASYPIQYWKDSINWEKMAEARNPKPEPAARIPDRTGTDGKIIKGDDPNIPVEKLRGRTISREVFAAVMFAAIVVLCINGLLTVVPAIVNDLVGEAFQSPNLFNEVSRSGGGGSGGGGIGSTISSMFNRGGRR